MRALFVHQTFPAQFRDLAPALAADPRNEVVFLTRAEGGELPGVRTVRFGRRMREPGGLHHYLHDLQRAVLVGQGAYRAAAELRRTGFVPDVVYGHSGFGPTLYLKEVFPEARLVGYFDWYYRPRGSNGDFFPDRPLDVDRACLFRARNAPILLDLATCDWGVVTTEWQLAQFPRDAWAKVSLLHDGIDTDFWSPGDTGAAGAPTATANLPTFTVPGGPSLSRADELVTYATRGMEPYRGFPQFLRAVELLLRRRPRAHVVIAGTDNNVYSWPPPGGGSWKDHLLAELDLDPHRVHFAGPLPRHELRQLLRAGRAHVYLSAPFIPSWSLFEAMSTAALVVGSRTPPVQELISDGDNGLLAEFFDHEELADRLEEALDGQERLDPLRAAARRTIVERYALADLLPRQLKLLDDVAAERPPLEVEGSVAARLADITVTGGARHAPRAAAAPPPPGEPR